ncbi:hypothetical protein HpBT321_08200 [Helicobacter pylori]
MGAFDEKIGVFFIIYRDFFGAFLNASDFKSMDDKQLLEQAGKVAPSEVPEFRAEVNKRLKAMKEEER